MKDVLQSYLAPNFAESLLARSASRAGVNPNSLRNGDREKLLRELEISLKMYLPEEAKRLLCIKKIRNIFEKPIVDERHLPRPSHIAVTSDEDLDRTIALVKSKANELGFSENMQTRIATAALELARNILQYAGKGDLSVIPVKRKGRRGLEVLARDEGPGIEKLGAILAGEPGSSEGMGLGLMGVKVLADDFDIKSKKGQGSKVTFCIYLDEEKTS